MPNSVMVIAPYRHAGTWVFDDPNAGLVREPFVFGMPEIIDEIVRGIKGATKGFRLLFSAEPFPEHSVKLVWKRSEHGGNWYLAEKLDMEGWLCPALFKYFPRAPREIYARAESLKREDVS